MDFYSGILPDAQRQVLKTAGALATDLGFYLVGGTALAIQVGHRRSVDFDWFTEAEIQDPLRLATAVRRAIPGFEVSGTDRGTLSGTANGVHISFMEYLYPLLEEPIFWPEYQCSLASLEDLACMKLAAIGGRGAKRDFIDVYALARVRFSLPDMLALFQQKFSMQDVSHILTSLAYFDDADKETTPEMLWDVDWKTIKRTIESWIVDLTKRQSLGSPQRGRRI